MSRFQTKEAIAKHARIDLAPAFAPPATVQHPPRNFELPTSLYVASAACYLGFLAILAATFSSPGLIIPMAIFGIFIGMFFAIPALFTRMRPGAGAKPMMWQQLRSGGIQTHTGRLDGNEAAVQVLILPVLIVIWGLAVALIAALV